MFNKIKNNTSVLTILKIFCISLIIGTINFFINTHKPIIKENIPTITAIQILSDPKSYILVDARYDIVKDSIKIENTVRVSLKSFDKDLEKFLDKYSSDKKVVVFCESDRCSNAEQVAYKLKNECSIKNITIFIGELKELLK